MNKHPRAPRVHTASSAQKPQSGNLSGAFGALIPELQRAVAAQEYSQPTPIQEKCIPHLLKGCDLIGSAQTGTGKTAAFALPLLQKLAADRQRPLKGTPRALILAPTRELAGQIGESIRTYGQFLKLSHTTIFGGVNQRSQVEALKRGVDILVATPGRLLDLMQQGYIHLREVEVFVLDEVDRMLDMGFIPDIRRVLSKLPSARQTLFFSATLAPEMEDLANTMVVDPVRVTIAPEKPTVDGVDQRIFFVGKRNKDSLLLSLLEDSDIEKVLVFIQMKHAANRLVRKLDSAGIEGVAIHGNKSQSARTKALDGFRRGHYRVLVATDVAARGLDVDGITHVINYDLPIEAETYVHRIGRTARAGATGDALSFCSAEDRSYLHGIERLLNKEVPIDLDHEFHCEQARHSTEPPPKRGGGGGGGKRGGGPAGESQKRRDRSGRGGQQFSKARRGSRDRARSHAGR